MLPVSDSDDDMDDVGSPTFLDYVGPAQPVRFHAQIDYGLQWARVGGQESDGHALDHEHDGYEKEDEGDSPGGALDCGKFDRVMPQCARAPDCRLKAPMCKNIRTT